MNRSARLRERARFVRLVPLVVLLAGLAECGLGGEPPALAVYVAPDGRDSNPGTLAAPFQTLERARDAVAKLCEASDLPAPGAAVVLRGGVYRIERSFVLGSNHSGRAAAPIVYRPHAGESARLTGGADIPLESWRMLSDPAVRGRIVSEAARDKIRVVDLKALGLHDYGELSRRGFSRANELAKTPSMELFVDGKPMRLARWPNEGAVRMGEILDPGPLAVPASTNGFTAKPNQIRAEHNAAYARLISPLTGGVTNGRVVAPTGWGADSPDLHKRGGVFSFDYDRPRLWAEAKDIWVAGVFGMSWEWSYNRVASIDAQARTVTLAYGEISGLNKNWFPDSHHFENLLEEVDVPGEYYIDRDAGLLYLYPPEALTAASLVTVSTLAGPLLSLNNVSHVAFERLTLSTGRSGAVQVWGGKKVRLDGLELLDFTGAGIVLSGGAGHAVRACHIHDVGRSAVQIGGGDWATLTPSGHAVERCRIHDCAYFSRVYQPAVMLYGGSVGVRVAHNLIYNLPHVAILVGGNDHVIEYNEIREVCRDFSDMGAIYANLGARPAERGTLVRRNFIHSIGAGRPHTFGVYMDNQTMGWRIEENVFWRMAHSAILLNSAAYAVVKNNLFIDTGTALHMSYHSFGAHDFSKEWAACFKANDFAKLPHGRRYPELLEFFAEDRKRPASNVFEGNLIFNPTLPRKSEDGVEHPEKERLQARNNRVVDEDPGFADARAGDFRLKPGADLGALIPGFVPIPFDRIGPGADAAGR